ncbi:hypothetical protein PENSPDRAFT_746896 [Peniophora sp. CONT]|nr:hypothetical protein PENSPDRAFT_746896 [Peniophora sp. CONT]
MSTLSSVMASHQIIKLEGPQPAPYIYPKTQAAAKIINPPDYKIVNFNYLFDYARATGHHRDRLPVWGPMKKSKHFDPFTGKPYKPLPPILFDLIGHPAGWGVSVAEAFGRGETLKQTFIGGGDNVLQGYRHVEIVISFEWPCFLHYKPYKATVTVRESIQDRYDVVHEAAKAMIQFLNVAAKWTPDPANRYWAPESGRLVNGINPYNLRLVALVNTHEKFWRCDVAIVRPTNSVPSDCFPTMLDPVQYQFF